MTRTATSLVLRLLALLIIALGAIAVAASLGWLSVIGIDSESSDSQVIHAIERTQEVSLLGLHIQGIKNEKRNSEVFGKDVPGTTEKVFLQYEFTAKLGIDGSRVKVTKSGEATYTIAIPEFIFIGYEQPTFQVAVEDGSLLSWVTPDIDKVDMINEILNDDARSSYIKESRSTLEDQTKAFYDSLITSIVPTATTTYEFGR